MPTNIKHIILNFLKWIFLLIGVIIFIYTILKYGDIWPSGDVWIGGEWIGEVWPYVCTAFFWWVSWGIHLYLKDKKAIRQNNSTSYMSSSSSTYKTNLISSLVANDLNNPLLEIISENKLNAIQDYFEYCKKNNIIELSEEILFIENYLESFRQDEQYFILYKDIDTKYEEIGITNMLFYPILNHFCHASTQDLEIHLFIKKGHLNLKFVSEGQIIPPKHSIVQGMISYQKLFTEEDIFINSTEQTYSIGVPLIS